jgi:hypothetical protein
MSSLAKKLQSRGHTLVDPVQALNEKRAKKGISLLRNEVIEKNYREDKDSSDEEESSEDSSEEESSEEEVMARTTPKKKKGSKTSLRPSTFGTPSFNSPSHIPMGTNSPARATFLDGNLNPVTYPMMSGYWDVMDFSNMEMTGKIMIRMVLHNSITQADIDASWENPTLLKIRFRWPGWFSSVLQMLEFNTKTENGTSVPAYGRDHQLTISFGKFVHDKMDKETREVWDVGYFSFDREMDTDTTILEVEVLDVTVGMNNNRMLQIIAQQAKEPEEEIAKKVAVGSRNVQTSSNAGKTFQNVRNREDLEQDMTDSSELVVAAVSNSPDKRRKVSTGPPNIDSITHKLSTLLKQRKKPPPTAPKL